MTDEKTIYVSPEDDVTTVRERLEKTSNRHVTLIIPAQTQLRSLVAWRVLHADARRMGKDVLIISTDPQIRSLAQAGKFRVAHSQAASITSKSRPPSRPGRVGGTGKGRIAPSSQTRTTSTRKTPDQRGGGAAKEGMGVVRSSVPLAPRSDRFDQEYGPVPEAATSQEHMEHPFDEVVTTGGLSDPYTSPIDPSEQRYGQIFDLHADTAPSIRNLPPQIDEDPSYLVEDYRQAQDILQSAQRNDAVVPPPIVSSAPPQTPEETALPEKQRRTYSQEDEDQYDSPPYRTTPLPSEPVDVYEDMEENIPRSSLAEQHGSATVAGLDTSEQPIHSVFDAPTEMEHGEIENLGDYDDNVKASAQSTMTPPHSWSESTLNEEQPDNEGPPHLYKSGSLRSSRRDNRENVSPLTLRQDMEDPDDLPPPAIEDRPTVVMPPEEFSRMQPRQEAPPVAPQAGSRAAANGPASTGAAPRGARPTSKRASQQTLSGGIRNPAAPRQRTQTPRAATNAGTRRTAAGTPIVRTTAAKKRREPSSIVSRLLPGIVGFLLILLLGLLAFFIPAADVTLALPSKDYSHAVMLKTAAPGQATNGTDVVPADRLSNDFIATGTGKATGSSRVGTASATGNVTFTNNGSTLVTLPTGTVVRTSGGTVFTTQAEAVVDVAGSNVGNTIQVPVQAQQSGNNGNVPAGAIATIPSDSLNAIALYNKVSAANLKLTVVNQDAITGGGAGTTPAVSQQDIDALKASIRPELDQQYNAWLGRHLASGDQSGVLGRVETVVNAPVAGQAVSGDDTFTEKLKLSVTVLVIRAATLQHASVAQLNGFLTKDKANAGYTVVSDMQHPVRVEQAKTSSDGKTVSLNYNAVGKIVPAISVQQVQSMINGKSVKDAHTLLMSTHGVQRVDISTSPNIGGWSPSWIPYWTGHINVHLVPVDAVTPAKK